MSIINKILRKKINAQNMHKLKNNSFSLISSNCNGAFICHDLNVRFNSPFVNLWMAPKDYIKFLSNIECYINYELSFIKEEGINYPVGLLKDVKIYFQHYSTEELAEAEWNKRKKRINFDNLFILFTDRDGCTYEDLKAFDELKFKNKVAFCHKQYPELKSAFYIPGFEKEDCVGMCFSFKNKLTGKKYYDAFDYVAWFNNAINK